MKIGYSILLGEHIGAVRLQHKDCEAFQIVCPACKEPVFKVERPHAADETLHFLSHYVAAQAYQADCELRVASLSTHDLDRQNGTSRDQRLKYFLSVLTELIQQHRPGVYAGGIASLRRSKAVIPLFDIIKLAMRQRGDTDFEEIAQNYLDDVGGFSTSFAFATQIRIARDLIHLLLTAPAAPNLAFLFQHSCMHLLARLMRAAQERQLSDLQKAMYYALIRFPQLSKRSAGALYHDLMDARAQPPEVETEMSYLSKLAAEINHEMVGTLLELPYFERLRDQQKNLASWRLGGST